MPTQAQFVVFLETEVAYSWLDYRFLMELCPAGIPMISFACDTPPYELFLLDWNRLSPEQSVRATAFLQQESISGEHLFTIPIDYIWSYYQL